MAEELETKTKDVEAMFTAGAHYAYSKSRRHPSAKPFIFGVKNTVEIFDLEKTEEALVSAKTFITSIGFEGKKLLFVGGKNEARQTVKDAAMLLSMPYVVGRWIGGTLTNFSEIKKRVARLKKITEEKEKGELTKYTKKERLLMDREVVKLEQNFGGLRSMERVPSALFVVDPKHEDTAVREARQLNIPIVALANSDCDLSMISYPIPANDSNSASIAYFVDQIVQAYEKGTKKPKSPKGEDLDGKLSKKDA